MIRIYINNKDYSTDVDDLQQFSETINLNAEDGLIEYGTSNTLTGNKAIYYLLKEFFFDNPCEGIKKELNVLIKSDSKKCAREQAFVIRPDSLNICFSDCQVTFKLLRIAAKDDAYECLRNQIAYGKDNGFLEWVVKTKKVYKIPYCHDLGFIQYVLLFIYNNTIKLLFDLIQLVCKIPGVNGSLCDAVDNVENIIIGCNKYHTAAMLSDIFEYNLNKCGLKFSSSIVKNDPVYKCTALEYGSNDGYVIDNCGESARQWNENDTRVLNVLQINKLLEDVFNSKGRIIGDTFHLERKDFFNKNLPVLLNVEDENEKGNLSECPEYSFNSDKVAAYLNLEFATDSIETQGNKIKVRHYDFTKEWNAEKSKNTKGGVTKNLQFGSQRYAFDEHQLESKEATHMAFMRSGGSKAFGIGSCVTDHWQILSSGSMSEFKLLIIDKKDLLPKCNNCQFHTVVKKYVGVNNKYQWPGIVFSYNEPLKGKALYDKFHFIDDPKYKLIRPIELDTIEWRPSDFCAALEFIKNNLLNLSVESKFYGESTPESITIDYENCLITFSGMKYRCEFEYPK